MPVGPCDDSEHSSGPGIIFNVDSDGKFETLLIIESSRNNRWRKGYSIRNWIMYKVHRVSQEVAYIQTSSQKGWRCETGVHSLSAPSPSAGAEPPPYRVYSIEDWENLNMVIRNMYYDLRAARTLSFTIPTSKSVLWRISGRFKIKGLDVGGTLGNCSDDKPPRPGTFLASSHTLTAFTTVSTVSFESTCIRNWVPSRGILTVMVTATIMRIVSKVTIWDEYGNNGHGVRISCGRLQL